MNLPELKVWLKQQQPILESIILEASKKYADDFSKNDNFGYDLNCSQAEGYNLMNGVDLCYDRYTTPLSYSLWYQGRRINVFLSNFLDIIYEACNNVQPLDIFDLGAGTGCVQFCFGLVSVALIRAGKQKPLLRIINVDSSPFMLNYLKSYLWPKALIHYPELSNLAVEYNVCSWSNHSDMNVVNPWICASYLFDSSDNEDYLSSHFDQLINDFQPEKILMLTSAQASKKNMISSVSKKMIAKEYIISNTSAQDIYSGDMMNVTFFRKELVSRYGLKASPRNVSWSDGSFSGVGLHKKQIGLSYGLKDVPQSFDLFNSPLRVRRDVVLNDLQEKAAEFDTRPVIITGPAGCGKSVVMTEKIINTIETFKSTTPLCILVTTFNKLLLKVLRSWVTDLFEKNAKLIKQIYFLGDHDRNDGTGEIKINDGVEIRIKFVHFEMLGKYIGGIRNIAFEENAHRIKILTFIEDVQKSFDLKNDEYLDILNADFILEEYHRVIYGLSCKIGDGLEAYQNIERKGRGTRIQLNSRKREIVWNALKLYVNWMFRDLKAGHSFIARRQLLLNKLSSENTIEKFDYVFVDEFQDCTPADFKIMTKLLKDVNNLVLSGDLAQSVHIGQSGIIPRDEAMNNRKYYRLMGSYRLPYRISEAIQPISKFISGYSADKDTTLEMTPSKGAPPGARPILVFGANEDTLAEKILSIKKVYNLYELKMITVLEYDGQLCRCIRSRHGNVETSTILKLKGLEKEMVVWSLQAATEFENEVMEFAYTIMTRTNCLLVIAVSEKYHNYYKQILDLLRKDRLIFWDKESEEKFLQLISKLPVDLEL
jgi:DNA helicase-2/ATP-dependent DNA helicase PcrA